MKYQWLIFKNVLKKVSIWILFLIILSFIKIILLKQGESIGLNINLSDLYSLLGIPNFQNFNIEEELFFLFQIGIICYFTFLFFFYEQDNSIEFVIPRTTSKKWILEKSIFLFLFPILFKTCIFVIVLFLTNSFKIVQNNYLILNYLTFLFISLFITSFLISLNKKKNYSFILIIIHILIFIYSFLKNSILIFLIMCIILFLNSTLQCDLKKY